MLLRCSELVVFKLCAYLQMISLQHSEWHIYFRCRTATSMRLHFLKSTSFHETLYKDIILVEFWICFLLVNFKFFERLWSLEPSGQVILRISKDNTHLSQWRPLDVVLGRLQRPKDSPYFGVLVFGTGFGCGNVRLVIFPLLCPAQPMGRL
jgi:hypothetical protein